MIVNGDQIEDISGAGKTDEARDYKLLLIKIKSQ